MNRALFLVLTFFCISFQTGAQKLVGTVKDQNSNAAIDHATVYFSSTSAGVFTDQFGRFEIDISAYKGMPLVISALGYYSNEIPEPDSKKKYTVLLTPKTYELDEVVVEAKGRSYQAKWKRNLEYFKKQFLGQTLNSQKCEILNESALYFSTNNGVFIAYAFKPLEIVNQSLGYRITYFLDRFEYNPVVYSVLIRGNIYFEDLTNTYNKDQVDKIEKRRKTTYLGSRMHFFRCLWENNLDSSGFELKNDENRRVAYNIIVGQEDGSTPEIQKKYLVDNGLLKIGYFSKNPTSTMTFNTDKVYFEKSGYFEPLDVSWSGEISRQRIADLLPFDYDIKEK